MPPRSYETRRHEGLKTRYIIGLTWAAVLEKRSARLTYASRYSDTYTSWTLGGTGAEADMIYYLIVDERMNEMRLATLLATIKTDRTLVGSRGRESA
jgi:hypothetical protein